jgi:hypothetical protein
MSSSLGHSGYIPLFALLASHRNLPERQTLVNLEPPISAEHPIIFTEPWGRQFNPVLQHQRLLEDLDLLPKAWW